MIKQGDFMVLFVIDYIDNDSDKAFVENLYIEYMPFLRSRAYKYVQDVNISNDLAHDCIVNMIKHLDKLKSLHKDKIRAYISVSINNVVLNYLKRSSRQVENGICDLSDNYNLSDDYSVEEEIERKYEYQTVYAGFDKLCERDKSIISMKYDLELNDSQIADVLNIKKDSVRMTVLRSVRNLKKQIKKQEELI